MQRLTRDQIAARVAHDIPDGACVNLGIGLPTLVANHLPKNREILLQSENGVLGMGPAPAAGEEDYDLINAGKEPVTLLPGGVYFHHADSFGMMRGGHLDICVLGAFQVSVTGDLANWHTGAPDAIPAVGGAMDLAIGAKQVFVMMDHLTKAGQSKIVERCTYPLTAVGCVNRIYTDLAVLDVTRAGLHVRELADGLSFEELGKLTGVPLLRERAEAAAGRPSSTPGCRRASCSAWERSSTSSVKSNCSARRMRWYCVLRSSAIRRKSLPIDWDRVVPVYSIVQWCMCRSRRPVKRESTLAR